MSNKELTLKELAEYVKNQAKKLVEEKQSPKALGDPTDVVMNKMVDGKVQTSNAKTRNIAGKEEQKAAKVATEDPMNVKMNQQDKEQGSDGKVATAVKVEAGGEKKSEQSSNAGMKSPDFESKKDNPSKESGDPFDEQIDVEMNSMDKEIDEGTKTFVEAGGEMNSDQATNVGMKKPNVNEKAKQETAPKPIADAIEMPKEGFVFKNRNELLEWVKNEAEKLSKII